MLLRSAFNKKRAMALAPRRYTCTPTSVKWPRCSPPPLIPLYPVPWAGSCLQPKMPLGRGPTWAALPHDLVQQAAGLLSDDADRWVAARAPTAGHAGRGTAEGARAAAVVPPAARPPAFA